MNIPKHRAKKVEAVVRPSGRRWEPRYEAANAGFTTCSLAAEIGRQQDHPEARMVRELKDRYACVTDRFALA